MCASESSSSRNVLQYYQSCKPETRAAAFERTHGGRKSGLLCVTPQTHSLLMKGFSPSLGNQHARLQELALQRPPFTKIGFKKRDRLGSVVPLSKISMKLKLLSQSVNRR